jgi:chemotaxis protein MotB
MTTTRSRLLSVIPDPATPTGKAWLVTFTDLICLMLTFFVMLYAMSSPKPMQRVSEGAGSAIGLDEGVQPDLSVSTRRLRADDLGYLGTILESQMAALPEPLELAFVAADEGLILSVAGDALFAPGEVRLSERGERVAFFLAGALVNVANDVEIAAYADPRPPVRLASNWEFSLTRADALARAMRRAGYERPLVVRGYGDARFLETLGAGDAAARMVQARRIELVIKGYRSRPPVSGGGQ